MRSQDIIRIARERAGLTQQQLAARSGRPRETIARWETGTQEPSFAALRHVVEACDLDLALNLTPLDRSLRDGVQDQLGLSPEERLARLLPADASGDAVRALRWLANATTPSIVIGSFAAALQGGPQRPDEGRIEFVSSDPLATEKEMRAHGFVAVDVDERWRDVDSREPWTLPQPGTLVLARNVPGTRGYADLRRSALLIDVGKGARVSVAHPRDLLRMADASPREAERARVPALRALLDEVA